MVEEKGVGPENRKYFRVLYPADDRPQLTIGRNIFPVLDISERGIRFLNEKGLRLAAWVKGTITFHDGESRHVEGKIVWERNGEVGIQIMIAPIPPVRIMEEQRYLIFREKST